MSRTSEEKKRVHVRQLYHVGTGKNVKSYTTACVIPPDVLKKSGLSAGDYVQVENSGKVVIIFPLGTISKIPQVGSKP